MQELEWIVEGWTMGLYQVWKDDFPESVSKKLSTMAEYHPKRMRKDLENYIACEYGGMDNDCERLLAEVSRPYDQLYTDIITHVMGQYSDQKLSQKNER